MPRDGDMKELMQLTIIYASSIAPNRVTVGMMLENQENGLRLSRAFFEMKTGMSHQGEQTLCRC